MEIRFFKAMLLANQEVNSATAATPNPAEPLDLQFAKLTLAYEYANQGIERVEMNDTFRRQMIRFSELSSFLDRQKRLKPMREEFRKQYGIGSVIFYLAPHLLVSKLSDSQSGVLDLHHTNRLGHKVRRVMKRFAMDCNEEIALNRNSDFTCFRSHPFIEVEKHCFACINAQLVLEHIYESLYFILKSFRHLSGFKSDDDFRRYITTEFTQNWMFNRFMERCRNGREDVMLSDLDAVRMIKDKNLKGLEPPDFYIREGNSIILFELKDILADARVKELRNFNQFLKVLRKKFYENDQGKPKAIRQLMANVAAIQKGVFSLDPEATVTDTIYPVIVVDSTYYAMNGMHTLLDAWMRELCRKMDINNSSVRPIILMDVATLRLYASLFNKDGFIKFFEDYYEKTGCNHNPNHHTLFESMISFSDYMSRYENADMDDICQTVVHMVWK